MPIFSRIAVVASASSLAAAAIAQPTFTVIAKTGQQVPGEAPGVVFARVTSAPLPLPQPFIDCTLDASGRVTLIAVYPTPQGNRSAIFRDSPAGLSRILYSGQPDPAHNNTPVVWSDVGLYSDGAAGGRISETTLAVNYGFARADPFVVPLLNGDPIAPSSAETWSVGPAQTVKRFAFNRAGEGIFLNRINTSSGAVDAVGYIDSQGVARELLRPNIVILPPGVPAGAMAHVTSPAGAAPPAIGADGTIAIGAGMTSNTGPPGAASPWIFVGSGGNLFPVINSFEDVPGLPAGSRLDFGALQPPGGAFQPIAAIAPDGHVAMILNFVNTFSAPIGGSLLYGSSAGVQAILNDKTHVLGLGVDIVVRLSPPGGGRVYVARGGAIAFSSYIGTTSSGLTQTAVFVGTPAGFHAITQSGAIYVPDPTLTITGAVPFGVNAFQDVLVGETLSGPGVTSSNSAVLQVFPSNAVPITLLRTGDTLTLAPGDQRIVRGFNLADFPVTGYSHNYPNSPINDSRQVAVALDFTDNSGAIIRFTYPGPACRPDLDRSGALTTGDIFEFITAWFAHEPRADFNDSGSVETQDIFDFLNAWFTGCT